MPRPDPKAHMKSWTIRWKGNKPILEQSTWAPGYTSGHTETEPEAIAMEVAHLMQSIADFREKWLNLNLLAEQHKHQVVADAFGNLISVTETDDPHEEMTMPEGAVTVPDQTGVWIDPPEDEICMICHKTGPGGFDCPHPDAHTPLANSKHDANGEDWNHDDHSDDDVPAGFNDYEVRGHNGDFFGYQGSARD